MLGLQDLPVKQIAKAYLYRAAVFSKQKRFDKAIQDLSEGIGLPDIPKCEKASALTCRGFYAFRAYGNIEQLQRDAAEAFELLQDQCCEYNYGLSLLFNGYPDKARKHCLAAIDKFEDKANIQEDIDVLNDRIDLLPHVSRAAHTEILGNLNSRLDQLRSSEQGLR